ncbi:MAG: hypothetical protein KC912_07220 [Proteobacteria bacterium]|nr:hypothetical protein [Pseudomonadota bacterium]
MRRLESHDWWPELVKLKDEKSLRELAEQFSVTPGAITSALRRQGISRVPAPPGPRKHRRAAAAPAATRTRGAMHQIEAIHDEVGTVPDDVIAEKAGVSRRTVANYRQKHGIAGYRGKRRRRNRKSAVDAYVHLLGTQPDANIAELAGVSGNAVRAYRVRRGIPSWRESNGKGEGGDSIATQPQPAAEAPKAAPAIATPAAPRGQSVWRVVFADEAVKFVAASTLSGAALAAEARGDVQSLERVGDML